MNNKSKQILYKSFLKDFKFATKGYSSIITKEELYIILSNLNYFKMKNDNQEHLSSFEERTLEYIYRISKQKVSNLKVILLAIESFYQVYKSQNESKNENRNISALKGCNMPRVLSIGALSPESKNY